MLQSSESSFASSQMMETGRRRSTFYVPLSNVMPSSSSLQLSNNENDEDKIYNPNLSACSFEWSLDCSDFKDDEDDIESLNQIQDNTIKIQQYGVILDGKCNNQSRDTSTPIRIMKSKSRSNILNLPDKTLTSPLKEKSKTLPQNLSPLNTFPPKNSFLLKSAPKISLNYSSDTSTTISPRKSSLSFIRRAHSTKITRNNSLLKSLTTKSSSTSDQSIENVHHHIFIKELKFERLLKKWGSDNFYEFIKEFFLAKCNNISENENCDGISRTSSVRVIEKINDRDEENAAHSDTSYEKACRRGSAPATPILGQKNEQQSTSRFTNFFSKRSFRSNPLKRTKSVTKLERSKRGPGGGLRGSRSHESLLSSHAVMSTIDLSCTGAVGVAPVHQSVLGRRYCFQVRGGPRGERYYSCGSRQERDIWIYSLRKSIAPNAESTRRTDNSLRMWIYEAKALPPKKKYFCEINLDKTLYGRTSVKLKTDLLFWGEYFDFPDIPEINVIHVNVFREGDKKKKRDKHTLVGSVKIPIHEVTSRTIHEDWYPIISEKHDSISRNSSKDQIPTLRIKCRFQSIDILPIDVYSEFLTYLKDNYKKVCELLEPVIGVKAKEDIGQALVLLMHAQGMAGAFLTDVVALDLLRVGDQRLTFRGNSLATKSMEAFLKLTGEQYLQDTLSAPISEIISSDRDCEVDPLKATGSLSRQQQSLRNAVKISWNSIAESHKLFPSQLRDCFATFRERLKMLDREDMADNLISASIFLRFLCPAILSPSLFNITNELPSGRATRNLTLVAKTLQTLANFTRFQGKENFMEFLNDFLEQEAGKMKEFLHLISTRTENPLPENVLDWSGYIDQGKQLSILHSLLSEALQKLQPSRNHDLGPLVKILEDITQAKESNNFRNEIMPTAVSVQNENQIQNQNRMQERGVIRGVLTPSSLEKNIFRYNDPTVSSTSLQHSHSASSISSVSNHVMIPTTIQTFQQNGDPKTTKTYIQSPSISTTPMHYYNTNERKSPAQNNIASTNGSIRANTLPRNNHCNNNHINGISTIEIRNNQDEINSNLIQIGLDPSNAFIRKSPTPLMKSNINGSRNRINGSQLSLLSDRSIPMNKPLNNNHLQLGLNLSLGIPHCDTTNNKNHSNMPMNLEDLEDLIKYADEQNELNNKSNGIDKQQQNQNYQNKENLTSKGSNISIGVCSSGYQSITTQSQSSSPIEQNLDNFNKNNSRMNAITNGKYQYLKYPSTSSSSSNSHPPPPLAFKNPLYHGQPNNNVHSSSLTPSSSEEQLSPEAYEVVGLNHVSSSKNLHSGRIPRPNPIVLYKRNGLNTNDELPIEPISYVSPPVSHHLLNRYQRRLSLESARTLSDSSTDTEGLCQNDSLCHTEGKRRRNGTGTGGRSVEQCERQIERLQASVDSLRHKLEESDLRESTDDLLALPPHSDSKMRSIISRLISMEEELRREQLKMSLALSHKQRVIEAQVQQIAALDAANNRLLTALSSLRKRYENQQSQQQQQQQNQPQQQQTNPPTQGGASSC